MKNEPRMDLMKLEAHHCFRCGCTFSSGPRKKTKHHSIPSFLKPKRNVLIPICLECHEEMNKYTLQSVPNFRALDSYLDELEKFVVKYKKKLGKYRIKEDKE